MPRVSVVIPTFNRAHFLPEAIASVLAQTYSVHEIVIVDDGSTDETAEVVLTMPPPVRYIHQQNSGPAAARNRGAATTTGEYLAFLDSDDIWEPEKLEIQLAVLQECKEARWCLTNLRIIYPDTNASVHFQGFEALFPLFNDCQITAHGFFTRFLKEITVQVGSKAVPIFYGDMFGPLFYGNFCSPVSLLIQRKLWVHIGGFDESFKVAEDTEFFHRLAGIAPGAIVMTPLIRVRRGHDSLISPKSTIPLIQNTLFSIDRAAKSRHTLTASEKYAYDEGKQRLLARLAYAHLTNLNGKETRNTISNMANPWRQSRIVVIYLASFLPAPVLHALHYLKRFLRHVNRFTRLMIH